MTRFTVKRSKWYRGMGGPSSKLRIPDSGMMCCLGFLAKELGFQENMITGKASPECLNHLYLEGKTDDFVNENWGRIMLMNDRTDCGQDWREEMIAKFFLSKGYEVEFVD